MLPYIGNSSYNIWGRCNIVVLTQTGWLTREAIRVACWGGLVNFYSNLLSGYRAEEGSIAYTWSLSWVLCWRSLSSVLEKLLLGFACWENFISVCQKLLPRYLAEKDWVSWTENCSHIMLRKNLGALHHKFLLIACGRIMGFLCPKLHTDMQTEIHTHAYNILRLIICMRKKWLDFLPWAYHILTLFWMITYFNHHALLSQNFVYGPYLCLKIYRWPCTWLVFLLARS